MPTEKATPDKTQLDKMRLDKWLWAARFFKTRSLAIQAIDHGRVKLNGDRVKPAREVKPGDRLELHIGDFDWALTVRALSMQRGPAPVAQTLYEEDPASHARRQQQVSERKAGRQSGSRDQGPSHQARPAPHSPLYRRMRRINFPPGSAARRGQAHRIVESASPLL